MLTRKTIKKKEREIHNSEYSTALSVVEIKKTWQHLFKRDSPIASVSVTEFLVAAIAIYHLLFSREKDMSKNSSLCLGNTIACLKNDELVKFSKELELISY